ncbi:MAG TPA: hypothetical protein VJR90_03155 [Gammaproteobacteria bacterium]|nr:hypothetical protein [Gammaproteobacteria bacterium]
MKHITVAAPGMMLAVMFSGCASLTAPSIVISPPSLHGEQWTINGTENISPGETKSFATILTVRVNGNPVIQGPVAGGGETSLNGTYESHDIQAVCPLVGEYTQAYRLVYVDGSQAATLFFGSG